MSCRYGDVSGGIGEFEFGFGLAAGGCDGDVAGVACETYALLYVFRSVGEAVEIGSFRPVVCLPEGGESADVVKESLGRLARWGQKSVSSEVDRAAMDKVGMDFSGAFVATVAQDRNSVEHACCVRSWHI